jgi:tetratricopeptide (TPR) repeat protein
MRPAYEDELHLLHSALQVEGFRFVLIAYNHISVYQNIRQGLVETFGKHRKIHEYSFKGKSAADIRSAVLRLNAGVMLFRDVEYLLREENADLCTYFNQRRDFFAKQAIAYLFFIEPGSFKQLAQKLPDWWSLRSLELECITPEISNNLPHPQWDLGDNSPYGNWTQAARDAEIERLARLVEMAEPENLSLLGALYGDIGEAYHYSAEYAKALENFEKSLAISRQIGDRQGEGVTLNNLATTAHAKGDYDTALRYLEQSLAIQQQIGDRQGEGQSLNNISQIYDAKGDYDTALRYLEQSLAIRQQIGDRQGEGATLNNLAGIARAKGDYDSALRYLEQSLAICQQIGDRKVEGTTLNNISQIYDAKGDYDRALGYLEQSLAIQQQIGDIPGMATTLHNIGATYVQIEQFEAAVLPLVQAYQIREKLQSPDLASTIGYLNFLVEKLGEAKFQQILQQQNQ